MLPAIVGASEFKDRAALVGCSIEISGSVDNQVGFWICAVDTAGEGILEKTFSAPTAGREEGTLSAAPPAASICKQLRMI